MGTQQMPPNQVLIGIALFLTIFQMGSTFTTLYEDGWLRLGRDEITQQEFIDTSIGTMRVYMLRQVGDAELSLFSKIAGVEYVKPADGSIPSTDQIPTTVLIPAFILGEITAGFMIGFLIYIPFIVIDMVVASILMAMGMMMLPPAMISLPFKLMLFVLANGWTIIIEGVIESFN
jgi:flagellar biosynthetic protein FliP